MPESYTRCAILLLITYVLVGCGFKGTDATSGPDSADSAAGNDTVAVEMETPAVSADLGAIQATLMYAGSDRPVRRQSFYVAELLPVEGNLAGSYVPALDTASAPRGESDGNGHLIMSLIDPGQYALALMTPLGPILVQEADSDSEILFEVVANQVTDLGRLVVLLDPELLEP